ncbi:PepSY domain-containing protein [Octadecabacter sp. 1_MG-2023]|uniref:PepSY-associated TM helix domain-containing protein n=1 Tax=unclassified Octadecabacter TaxID=196158 RepID=UPI001C08450C|nr:MULTISPECIES: PepSY domain-containing protein [unclassified Octadecabacter]MBU2993511.1 PepSY domain-containing protein [Octadecabacter sp. B2R22]MDO6733033.1 PepSY domain-containing protein [Octadecabacter sp. 1_MG-2023]
MTDTTVSAQPRGLTTGGAFYRLVWKWHFLASLYVLPFMMLLATTGGIYLYKPQIENLLYADQMYVEPAGPSMSFEMQLAALRADPGINRLRGITDYGDPTRSTMVEFDNANGERSIAWVNPTTGVVLGSHVRDKMPMRVLRNLHGTLLMGDFGTKFVELAAHWAIVMFITGAYLWWPRGKRTLRKAVSLPEGKPSQRSWWRETHLFAGLLATILVVPILITGLPWTDIWGGGLSYVQDQTGQSSKSLRFSRSVPDSTASEGTTLPFTDVFEIASAEGLTAPYEMRPPRNDEAAFWIRSASSARTDQSELIIDQYSGAVLQRFDFADNPIIARTVSQGISFHQGELYGWLNLAQNTIAALLALLLSVSGFVAWWKRRPAGKLGVPAAPEAALGWGMMALVVGLSLLFPLVGASLIVALILDWLLFRRLGLFRT